MNAKADEEEKEDFLVDLGGNEKAANDSKDKGKYTQLNNDT